MCRRFYWCILLFAVFLSTQAQAEEFKFDPSEVEKKFYHLGGYMELKPSVSFTDKEASLYKLRFYDRSDKDSLKQITGTAQLEGSLEKGITRLFARANFELDHSYLGWSDQGKLFEGYLALKPSDSFNITMGKQTMKWGKGYAWNPVAFVDRPKNPDEPDLNLEGFYMASANFIKSFEGPLKTISFTPVIIPAYGEINNDFGEIDKLNFAAKLYLLYYDTDIDFMLLTRGSKSPRYGFDFSKNLFTNLEIHGEFAWQPDSKRTVLDRTGKTLQEQTDAAGLLLGLRYLSAIDTTYIIEYYHNGTGYSDAEEKEFFSFINRGYEDYISGACDASLEKAQSLSEKGYGRPNFMQDYLYARISQKEPFSILYFTPALTWILNLSDQSFTISPEFSYTGITNLEFRLKGSLLAGDDLSEYGEKQNDYRLELRIRYYF